MSFSTVDHLRWDLRQVFEMAVAEGFVERNPAALLFTPREAQRPVHRLMTTQDIRRCIEVIDLRERIIVKLAVRAGMRPGEIFGLTWNRISTDHVEIVQRVYRGTVDTPKTHQSIRRAAIPVGLAADIAMWREFAADTKPQAFVFASERKTPLAKENVWRRNILPRLSKIGIEWVNFQVMRRTHASIMKELGVDPKWVADQLGHSLDVSQNVYTQVSVEQRLEAVQQLESALVM
ncbi:MAG: tyrosine-type recombinase/integrase [Alloacidobacterium sp.]